MFNKFKNLARSLFIVFVLNIVVFNFNVKYKNVDASILDSNFIKVINYDLKKKNEFIIFDFTKYLSKKDKIESFELKKGNDLVKSYPVDGKKKTWKAIIIPSNGEKYKINAVANINGEMKNLLYEFLYNDYNSKYKVTPKFKDSDLEIQFDKKWIGLFDDEQMINLSIHSFNHKKIIEENNISIKSLKENLNKKVFSNVRREFRSNKKYYIKVEVNNVIYKWRVLVNYENKIVFNENNSNQLSVCELEYFQRLNYDVKLNKQNNSYVDIEVNNVDLFLHKDNSQNSITIYELNEDFSKGIKIGEKSEIVTGINSVDIKDYKFSENKSYLIEVTFKNNTICAPFIYKTRSIEFGNKNTPAMSFNVVSRDGENQSTDINNITSTIKIPLKIENVKQTSFDLSWEYPANFDVELGSRIDVFFKVNNENSKYSSIPHFSLVHGTNGLDLHSVTKQTIEDLSPSTDYKIKFVLASNSNNYAIGEDAFKTRDFELLDYIKIKGAKENASLRKEAYPRSREVEVQWEYSPKNTVFKDGDKVEIFTKLPGSNEFTGYVDKDFKNPLFTSVHSATNDLSKIESAKITLPSWFNNFYVDLIYTISGKQIITKVPTDVKGEVAYNRKTVNPTISKPKLEIKDIAQTSAKIVWEYDKDFLLEENKEFEKYKPENGHAIRVYMKKIPSLTQSTNVFTEPPVVEYIHGEKDKDGNTINILEKTEYLAENLKPEEAYRVKLVHILQYPSNHSKYPGYDGTYKYVEEFYNFETSAFYIKDLKGQQEKNSPTINVTWTTESIVPINDTDNIKVFLKEAKDSVYPTSPVHTLTVKQANNGAVKEQVQTVEDPSNTTLNIVKKDNAFKLDLPKYNTVYNVMIQYTVQNKVKSQYAIVEAKGDLRLNISDIKKTGTNTETAREGKGTNETKWDATISWTYPDGYDKSKRPNDKVKLEVKERTQQVIKKEKATTIPLTEEIPVSNDEKKQLSGLEDNKTYDVILSFLNGTETEKTEVYKIETYFTATDKFQVSSLVVDDIKLKSGTLKWDYVLNNDKFKDGDTLEIFIKNTEEKKGEKPSEESGAASSGSSSSSSSNESPSSSSDGSTTAQQGSQKIFKTENGEAQLFDNRENKKNDLKGYAKIYTVTHKETPKTREGGGETEVSPSTQKENETEITGNEFVKHESKNLDLSKFKSLNLTGLTQNHDYTIAVKYTLKDRPIKNPSDPKTMFKQDLSLGSQLVYAKDGEVSNETKKPIIAQSEFEFRTKADAFKSTVYSTSQTTATYGWLYPQDYTIQKGDKIEIYLREDGDYNQVKDSNGQSVNKEYKKFLELVHGNKDGEEKEINLNEITRVDISGLTPNKKYKSGMVFTMNGLKNGNQNQEVKPNVRESKTDSNKNQNETSEKDPAKEENKLEAEIDFNTQEFGIKSFTVDSYKEYDILVNWEVEPEGAILSDTDTLEIYVKRANEEAYNDKPTYKLPFTDKEGNTKLVTNTFSDYVQAVTIGEEQKMKLVYTIGSNKYEKELTFTNTIEDMKAEVLQIDETRAIISVTTPNNYEFVKGDKLLIYAKDEFAQEGEIENPDYLVFEGEEGEELSISEDMKSIELSYLLPEAKYDVLVALKLQDGTSKPAKLEFKTKELPVTDINLEYLRGNNAVITWGYGDNKIDFFKDDDSYDFSDKLIIAHKESDGTPFEADIEKIKSYKHVEYLGAEIEGVKDASIQVIDPSKEYDVIVCYDLGGVLYMREYKVSYLAVSVDKESMTESNVKANWVYPNTVEIKESDETKISIRKKSDKTYPEPTKVFTGTGTTTYEFGELEKSTYYIIRLEINTEGSKVEPVEVLFKTKTGEEGDVVIESVDYEIKGTEAKFEIPNAQEIQVDTSQSIGLKMGDEAYKGFTVKFDESGTGFVIEPTIPKKKYTNIEVELPLKDGKTYKMVIKEFVTQPENLTQDWLSNSYWFAFERFPDEEGYNYWYEDRMLKKDISGEYFLNNLMFAEDEFTNRNLSDNDLIAALYQIVVNREFDQEGLNFWVGVYNENLKNSGGNKKQAQQIMVTRMVYEPEFGKLCDKAGIFWKQSDLEAAKVPNF